MIFKDVIVYPEINNGLYQFRIINITSNIDKLVTVESVVGGGFMYGGGTQTFFAQYPDGSYRFLPFDYSISNKTWFVQLASNAKWVTVNKNITLDELYNWPPHRMLGDVENVKHIEMKWLNDGSMIPKDVTIVTDLAIHPISILSFFLIKFKDVIDNIQVVYANNTSVLINGQSKRGVTFNIEVSNSSKKKMRSISIYSTDTVYRWNSDNEFFIENVGDVQRTDAIEENIKHFFSKNSIGYPLDIARSLENVNELFSSFGH